jgi:hypothetical protein
MLELIIEQYCEPTQSMCLSDHVIQNRILFGKGIILATSLISSVLTFLKQ